MLQKILLRPAKKSFNFPEMIAIARLFFLEIQLFPLFVSHYVVKGPPSPPLLPAAAAAMLSFP